MFRVTTLLSFLFLCNLATAQSDSLSVDALTSVPKNYIKQVDKKVDRYEKRITGKKNKSLEKLSRWEKKVQRLLAKTDPALEQKLFGKGTMTFSAMLAKVKSGEELVRNQRMKYDEYRDKLTVSISYLESQEEKLESSVKTPIQNTKSKLADLEGKVQQVESLDDLIQKRKKELATVALKTLGKNKYLTKINKEAWYYSATLKNYKEIFSDPTKAEKTAREVLNKVPAFQVFMKQNSQLAKLFKMPENYGSAESLAGLQTRADINGLINDKLASGGPNAKEIFQQNLQKAQSELAKLKADMIKKGDNGGGGEMPDFKPNMQKTKTFSQRLEYGFNMQFGKSNNFLPATSDLGFSVGYKLNDKSIIGIGAAYKIGFGSIEKIRITQEGISLRSFIDYKLKKQFYVSGGAEMNRLKAITSVPGNVGGNEWQPSALLGISKKIPLKSKLSKGTKLQLLYDFLGSNASINQRIRFRIGYSF